MSASTQIRNPVCDDVDEGVLLAASDRSKQVLRERLRNQVDTRYRLKNFPIDLGNQVEARKMAKQHR